MPTKSKQAAKGGRKERGVRLTGGAANDFLANLFVDQDGERALEYTAGPAREAVRRVLDQRKAILAGVMRVQAENCANMVADPDGEFPACKPGLGTRVCERCGRDISERNGKACPSIPPEQRWSFARQSNNPSVP